jgi:hypothetical protein
MVAAPRKAMLFVKGEKNTASRPKFLSLSPWTKGPVWQSWDFHPGITVEP